MRKPKKEIQLTSYDELLGINEAEQNTLNCSPYDFSTICREVERSQIPMKIYLPHLLVPP